MGDDEQVEAPPGPRPLAGVRVLDLSRVLSGPSCSKALADLGAEVVKLEPPEGDLTRTAQPRVDGIPVYFAQQNCGKDCISLDLTRPEAQRIALGLAAKADILLENFRPGVMTRLGLGYDAVHEANPSLVYCSITGYGQDGPLANRRAYAPVLHAELGLIELASRRRRMPPVQEAVSFADFFAGLQATIAVLAALRHRDATGEGQHVDISMAETMLQSTEWTAVELAGGEAGRFHVFGGANAPVLHLSDGSVAIVSGDPVASFPRWCAVMGRPELLEDPRFATPADRAAHRPEMAEAMQAFASGFDSFDSLEQVLAKGSIASGLMRSLAEVKDADWAEQRGALTNVGTEQDPLLLPRSPARYSVSDAGTSGRPSYQGEDNRRVLRSLLDMSDEEIDRLEGDGLLIARPPAEREERR